MTGPIIRRIRNRAAEPFSRVRNKPGKAAQERLPKAEVRNIGGGEVVGALGAGLATVLEDTLGVPFGASVDIVNVEPTNDGDIYTVNVNSPTENIARARAILDSGTGFTSYLVDEFDIDEAEVLNKRFLRDTYQIEVRIKR